MSEPREIPHGSLEEEQITRSILYGLLWKLLVTLAPLIEERFAFERAHVERGDKADRLAGVIFTGLTIEMASGTYRVQIERVRS